MIRLICFLLSLVLLNACASYKPSDPDNVCTIFKEKRSWYKGAKQASKKWKSPIATIMAFIHQESAFKAKARPPRKRFLWLFPGRRPSSSYGFSQAKTQTWRWYKEKSGNRGAERDSFKDAADFVAWYNTITADKNKVNRNDTYHLYLAYHEGHGGFQRGSYKKKPWLQKVARKVDQRAKRYDKQLHQCQKKLNKKRWLLL